MVIYIYNYPVLVSVLRQRLQSGEPLILLLNGTEEYFESIKKHNDICIVYKSLLHHIDDICPKAREGNNPYLIVLNMRTRQWKKLVNKFQSEEHLDSTVKSIKWNSKAFEPNMVKIGQVKAKLLEDPHRIFNGEDMINNLY